MADGITPPTPPVQLKNLDLTRDRRRAENAPVRTDIRAVYRSPAEMMRELGFDPTRNMTPLQFLVAVYNNDMEAIFKDEKKRNQTAAKGGIGLSYRMECAKTAARYFHMEMPKVQINEDNGNFGESLTKAAMAGNDRLRTRQVIIETVERISPDMPLPDASYPAIYDQQKPVINQDGTVAGEVLNPEGDKDYNPDAD